VDTFTKQNFSQQKMWRFEKQNGRSGKFAVFSCDISGCHCGLFFSIFYMCFCRLMPPWSGAFLKYRPVAFASDSSWSGAPWNKGLLDHGWRLILGTPCSWGITLLFWASELLCWFLKLKDLHWFCFQCNWGAPYLA
jgi:hypothetical protein